MRAVKLTIIGIIAIFCFLLYGQPSAVIFISGHASGTGTTSWSNWDETTEAGWKASGTSTYIVLFENTVAGGNETGQGLHSGTSLAMVQSGNIAGAAGSPPQRSMDGSDDYFAYTGIEDTVDVGNGGTWTLIIKTENLETGLARGSYFVYFYDASTGDALAIICRTSDDLRFEIWDAGVHVWGAVGTGADATPGQYSGVSDVYVVCQFNSATNVLMAGFSKTTKPTKFTELTSGVSQVVAGGINFAEFDNRYHIGGDPTHGSYVMNDIYYFLMSKEALLDNS